MSSKKARLPQALQPRSAAQCDGPLKHLLAEALAICGAIDRSTQTVLANLLDMWIADPVEWRGDQASGLAVVRWMFIYAHAEARDRADRLPEKLEFCIACLAERIERASVDILLS